MNNKNHFYKSVPYNPFNYSDEHNGILKNNKTCIFIIYTSIKPLYTNYNIGKQP